MGTTCAPAVFAPSRVRVLPPCWGHMLPRRGCLVSTHARRERCSYRPLLSISRPQKSRSWPRLLPGLRRCMSRLPPAVQAPRGARCNSHPSPSLNSAWAISSHPWSPVEHTYIGLLIRGHFQSKIFLEGQKNRSLRMAFKKRFIIF